MFRVTGAILSFTGLVLGVIGRFFWVILRDTTRGLARDAQRGITKLLTAAIKLAISVGVVLAILAYAPQLIAIALVLVVMVLMIERMTGFKLLPSKIRRFVPGGK